MTAHTAPPYRTGGGGKLIAKDGDDEFTIAFVRASPWGDNEHDAMQANAAYIALACNAHEALVEAVREVRRHVAEEPISEAHIMDVTDGLVV